MQIPNAVVVHARNEIRRIKMKSNYIKKQISIRLSQDEFNLFKELYRDRCMELAQYISKTRFIKERIFQEKYVLEED